MIDPHGTLYRALLDWLALMQYSRPIVLFNPSHLKRIVGFNPFITFHTDEARLMTKAERLVTSTLRIRGAENPNSYSNIERWLRCIYYVVLEQQLSVGAIRYFLYWHQKPERDKPIKEIKSESIKDQRGAPDGITEIKLRGTLKSIDRIMSGLKTRIEILQGEGAQPILKNQ